MGKITKKELSESLLQIINDASRIELITGILDNLNTDDKSNLVNAINEIIQETNSSLEKKASKDVATTSAHGLMSSTDKVKLNGIAAGANNYVHPNDANTRHVTDAEKATWNAKASTAVATTTVNGLMSSTDKTKLDGIATGANKYIHPDTHPASVIVQDASNRFVTDAEKAEWNAKASTTLATTNSNGLMSSTDKTKLDGIATGANNYVHPNNANTRHVTDAEKATWNAKASTAVATTSTNGLMSSVDKTKLDGIAAGANKYIHPDTHPASVIVQDTNNRFVTDAEKAEWNDKYTKSEVDNKISEVISSLDWKESVNTYNDLLTSYPNPVDGWTVNTKDKDETWRYDGSKWVLISANNIPLATQSTDGKMSSTDKTKLDGIATGANKYIHPSTHPASIITQDASNRFVTDSEKATWNAKASTTVASSSANGLMSSSDKTKLDGIATGANRVIVNNTLTSTSTSEALSAAQGKILDEKIKNKFESIRKDLTGQTIDLNNINLSTGVVTEQSYCEKSTGGAANITNAPVNQPFVLDVKLIRWGSSSDYITQQIFTSATTKLTYERFCTNGTWTEWNVVAKFKSTPTNGQILIADGNGIKTSGYTIATSVPSGAKFTDTVYTHPSTHPASMIVQDANNRFVTDAEKAAWNAKPSTALATTSTNGLMSSTDKAKLNGIAAGANNYVHPGSGTNPHGTTKADVGLGNVNNWGATTAVNSTSTTTYATASAVKQAYDLAASKANASHGNHVPTTQTANNAVFLRNDNTWQTVTPANIGAAASSHTHNYAGSSSAGGAATTALACTGNSATATKLQTARTINGTKFDGSANITITAAANGGTSAACSGNSATATKLATARTINGTAFDGSANITITAAANGGTSAACSGNSATATKLATARTINGTAFNGSANITTANWGTARTLTIGSTGKSVNGSANVSWSLAEIGAAAASHTHSNYLPLTGGTLTGGINYSGGGYNNVAISFKNGDATGAGIALGAGGSTIIGSGESAKVILDNVSAVDETLWLASDASIKIATNMQSGYASRVESTIDGSGNLNMAGSVTVNKKVKMNYNNTTESLDFIFV